MTVFFSLSVLLSIALPAIQVARNQSRDTRGLNNLKQIGLALHNYHDVYDMFPPGWISERSSGEGHPSNGWMYSILPFANQAPLYNRVMKDNEHIYRGKEPDALKTPVPTYRCGWDSIGDTNPMRGGWGTANYSGNFGPTPIARWSSSDYWPGQTASPTRASRQLVHGMFLINTGTRIRDITDGTTNTIHVGEKSLISKGGIWPGPRSNFHESDVVSDLSYYSPLNRSETGFSSRRPGGILNFLFCDGAVRPISPSVQSLPVDDGHPHGGILQFLAGRNDRQRVPNLNQF